MTKDLWLIEYERIGEDLVSGRITQTEAFQRLRALGLDRDEIDCHLAELALEEEP